MDEEPEYRVAFVFGPLADPAGKDGFVFAFAILPTIIFMAAFFAVLYHFGIMQVIIRGVIKAASHFKFQPNF